MISWNLVEVPSFTDDDTAARRSEEQIRRRAVRKAQQLHAQQNAMAARTLSMDLRQDVLRQAARQAMDVQEAEQAELSMPMPTPKPVPAPAPMAALREGARPADDAAEEATVSGSAAAAAAAAESSEASAAAAMQQPTEAFSQALADTRTALESIGSAHSLDLEAGSREMQDSSWHERAEASLDFIEAYHAEALSDPDEKSRLLATLADAKTLLRKMLAKNPDGDLSALLASSTWIQQLAIESRRADDSLPVLTLRAV